MLEEHPSLLEEKTRELREAPLIGRDKDIAKLMEALHAAAKGSGGLFLVQGESGSGKSRLIHEFASHAERSDIPVFTGQSLNQSVNRPFNSLSGVIQGIISHAQSDENYLQYLRERLDLWSEILVATFPQLASILACETEQNLGPEDLGEERCIRAMTVLLNSVSPAGKPAVIILEDAQWCDELTLKVLASLERNQRTASKSTPALIVIGFRSDEVPAGHILRRLRTIGEISLRSFSSQELQRYLEAIAGLLSPDIVDIVGQLSGGKPFMAMTVFRGLVEMGIVSHRTGRWQLEESRNPDSKFASQSAQQFLQNRLDLLDKRVLTLLQVGAIMGKEFEGDMLRQVTGLTLDECSAVLQQAMHRGFIEGAEGLQSFRFVHDKLRESVVDSLSLEERAEIHRNIATLLQAIAADDCFSLSFHFSQAGLYAQAFEPAVKAARIARERSVLESAEVQYRIALRGIEASTESSIILREFGEVLILRAKFAEAEEVLNDSLARSKDSEESALIEISLAELKFRQGEIIECRNFIRRALEKLGVPYPESYLSFAYYFAIETFKQIFNFLFAPWIRAKKPLNTEEARRDLLITRVCNRDCYSCWFLGDLPHCMLSLLRAVNRIEPYQYNVQFSFTWSNLAPGMLLLGQFRLADWFGRRAVSMARAFGDRWCIGHALSFYATATLADGRFSLCIEQCLEAVSFFESTGDSWERNIANANLVYGLYRLGNLREAQKLAKRYYQEAVDTNDRASTACFLAVWAKSAGGEAPIELIDKALADSHWYDKQSQCELHQAAAIYYLGGGEYSRAVAILREAWSIYRGTPMKQEYMIAVGGWFLTALRCQAQFDAESIEEFDAIAKEFLTILPQVKRINRRYRNGLPQVYREEALFGKLLGYETDELLPIFQRSMNEAIQRCMEYDLQLTELALASSVPSESHNLDEAIAHLESMGAKKDFYRLFLPLENRSH